MLELSVRYLYEAARSGSMRLASEKIGVAVSSISRQIAQLERDLGVTLIEKNRRNLKLTEAGQIVFDFHRDRMLELDALHERISSLRGMKKGSVHLSVGEGFLSQLFIDMVTAFRRENRGIDLTVTVQSTVESVRAVLDDEVHIALVFQSPSEPRIRVRAAVPQPLQAVCHPDHPLAQQTSCTLPDLARHPLALVKGGTRMRDMLSDAERKRGVWLSPEVVSNSIFTLRELARAGEFVTVLPKTSVVADMQAGTLVALPIAEPELEVTEIAIITRLGRQLGQAPARILPLIETKLRAAI